MIFIAIRKFVYPVCGCQSFYADDIQLYVDTCTNNTSMVCNYLLRATTCEEIVTDANFFAEVKKFPEAQICTDNICEERH